jgi:UDP-glucose 4-epimerase
VKVLVTGGAGFIGRAVVARLLADGHETLVVDDLSNGRRENVRDFEGKKGFLGLLEGDIKDATLLERVFREQAWDTVFHLAASIHVQGSIDDPRPTFENDVVGTFQILEHCREQFFSRNGLSVKDKKFDYDSMVPRLTNRGPRVVVMSTCMVYGAGDGKPISEAHAYRPASPYAASKIASDNLSLSYFWAYNMPVTVVRPFNTYGPFQKSNSEGGVVSIFLKRDIAREPLLVKGTGEQTRDLLYVDDCADFVVRAGASGAVEGRVLNAGTGTDVSIRDLARMCATNGNDVKLVAHDHPQAEIMRLNCDASQAREHLGWAPTTTLEQGLAKTRAWLEANRWAW